MKEKIEKTLEGLKDFQLKTVDYIYDQMYVQGRDKMLVADEVGLGKTIVAKGIIAKAYKDFKPTLKKQSFNVIYICSNQALAKQNLKKLNFTGDSKAIDYSQDDDRITGLAYISNQEEQKFSFRIKAFTPATSFDDKTHAGKSDERILLYRLLYTYSDFQPLNNSLKWLLKGNRRMKDENWENRINDSEALDNGENITWIRKILPSVKSKFRKELEKVVSSIEFPKSFNYLGITNPIKFWTLLIKICSLNINQQNYHQYDFIQEIISKLRFKLSKVCVEFLNADIFILDEFQRYKKLIENRGNDDNNVNPAIELAREIFSIENAKILLLSATPFKPYTNDFDEIRGEIHYNEFMTVLRFLMADKSEDFWKQYEQDRKSLYSYLRHPSKLEEEAIEVQKVKQNIESIYRQSIVRTEKLLVSHDKNSLIEFQNRPLQIHPEDIQDFVILDRITQYMNDKHKTSLPAPLEYVKSCPFTLSFLDSYQHKEKIRRLIKNDLDLIQLVKKTKNGWVNQNTINEYKPLIPKKGNSTPNPKLRLLLDETVLNNGWKYLWIPPSIPYYELSGAYKKSWGYSKTLIFSSWKLVPKMVATLVSYESERLSIGNPSSISERKRDLENLKPRYFQKRRSPRPQFTFKILKKDKEPKQMNNFILTYPSVFLAELYDPAKNINEKQTLNSIKTKLKKKLKLIINELNLNRYVSGSGDWQKWYWLAPILLDKSKDCTILKSWFERGFPLSDLAIDSENNNPDKEESNGKKSHFELALSVFLNNEIILAGTLTETQLDEVCNHLANLTLGSPAICSVRALSRHKTLDLNLLDAAYNISSAFLTMFNKPESIAVVRLSIKDGDYWERVLEYAIDGNIQSMLDEFVYLLINGENIQSISEISDYISDVLSVRTVNTDIDFYSTFIKNQNKEKRKLRCHYAVDFGGQKISTAKGAGRQINIRQAFNSPFRPFVLASTSIGQEGLDFHLYCKKIFHWNLPANPIDFEQREGRIHRYQGFVIRLNLAEKYRNEITLGDTSCDVWKNIFKYAEKEKEEATFPCDLVPFWHTEPTGNIKIERFVPLYPFSCDLEKYKDMIKTLTYYRLTFGQPRQDELVDALYESGLSYEDIKKLEELTINLSPIKFCH